MALKPLILASTSPYRKELMSRLGLPFSSQAPVCDEDSFKAKINNPQVLAETLASEKALSLSAPGNCVIGGDQLVHWKGQILGKPKTKERAYEQLLSMSGHWHELVTATCVFYGDQKHLFTNITRLKMRNLTPEQLHNYIAQDLPLDCAGSYKIEKSGLVLFEKIETDDFSAIQGLPLLKLTEILSQCGYNIPGGHR